MSLDLPTGTACFVDANILYYCFTEVPPVSDPCRRFLRRVADGELFAHTTAQVLSDAIHKTMLAEVAIRFGQERAGMVGWLKKHPESLTSLPGTAEITRRMLALPLRVLPIESARLADAIAISAGHQLLMNDALIVAVMQHHRLTHLATNDNDFDRVASLSVWKPR